MNVGLRQGCVMSPRLFNVYMDIGWCGESRSEWVLRRLLFADDAALMAESAVFGRVCERRKLRVNVDKSKVMVVGRVVGPVSLNIQLTGETMEEVQSFKYLLTVECSNI